MYYGKDKSRQMGRSILPSARRKGAREDLAAVKRKNRTNIRQALKKIDPFEPDDFEADLNFYPDHEINYIRRDRRAADKLAHFERWAEKITAHLPTEERLGAMKAKLPPGLIGDHAMSHLENREHFLTEETRNTRFWWRVRSYHQIKDPHEDLEERLRWIIVAGHHKAFNRRLRRQHRSGHPQYRLGRYDHTKGFERIYTETTYCDGCVFRPLLGLHDIEDFIDHHRRQGRGYRNHHADWEEVVWYEY